MTNVPIISSEIKPETRVEDKLISNPEPKADSKPDVKLASKPIEAQPNEALKPKRSKLLVTSVVFGVLVAISSIWWFTRPPMATATVVGQEPLLRTLQFSARVATTSRVDVGSVATGRVVKVLVVEGAEVRRGDVLLSMETTELDATLLQSKAAELQASARLAGIRSTGLMVAEASVSQADSVENKAASDLARIEGLAEKGFVSSTQRDQARSALEVAIAQSKSALAQRRATQSTDVSQAQSQLAVARAATAAASARLGQSNVLAPADAKVLTRLVEPGQIVQPGKALFSLALVGPVRMIAQVDEKFLEELRVGQPASILADAFPKLRFQGSVQSIAPVVDAQRGAVEVKLRLVTTAPDFFKEDMTLSVEVETGRIEHALVVPVGSLRSGSSKDQVYVLLEQGGKVVSRDVVVGMRTLKFAEITSGLADGDTVLTGPPLKVGSRIRVNISDEKSGGKKNGS
jgi:HlyD family secretion protein